MVNDGAEMLTTFPLFPALGLAALAVLGFVLFHICHTDVRRRRISNDACLAAALAALPFWVGLTGGHPGSAIQPLLIFTGSIPLLLLLWGMGLVGGGDVKLLAALMLWMTNDTLPVLLFTTAMSGAAIGLLIVLFRRLRGWPGKANVPYGLAIALGAAVALAPAARALVGQIR